MQSSTDTEMDIRHVAIVYVRCGGAEIWQKGIELKDGGWQGRNYRGISETLHEGETAFRAAIRGLFEELGVVAGAGQVWALGLQPPEKRVSPSTGRETLYYKSEFSITLPISEKEKIPLRVAEEKGTLVLEWRAVG